MAPIVVLSDCFPNHSHRSQGQLGLVDLHRMRTNVMDALAAHPLDLAFQSVDLAAESHRY
jgi:hypothetical protein